MKPLSALMGASVLGLALLLGRTLFFQQGAYFFYVWNLFLAWLPLLFALGATRTLREGRHLTSWIAGLLWLLFLPNAPYLVTDIKHWGHRPPVPPWFDLLLCVHFAWLGLALGFTSLRLMESAIAQRLGRGWGRGFAGVCLCLTSFGVYLGRFGRWNSWDILRRPGPLAWDVTDRVFNPLDHRGTWAFTLVCGLFLLSAYWILASWGGPHPETHRAKDSGDSRE